MGTPVLPLPIEHGVNCSHCTPALWADGETPKHIYLYFTGIVDCHISLLEPPNGRTFKLTQADLVPCRWDYYSSRYNVIFYAREMPANHSYLYVADAAANHFFRSENPVCPPDLSVVENDNIACVGDIAGTGGHCIISYHNIVTTLAVEFGLDPGPYLFSELFLHPDGDVIVKLCNKVICTNVCIRL